MRRFGRGNNCGLAAARGGAAGERGFTLVELLLTIAILAVISGVLATVFITTARSTKGVAARYEQSHDAQIASAYLATDVQSNAALTTTECGAGSPSIINFGYADGTIVTYAFGAEGGETRLTRRVCSGGSLTSSQVLVHQGGQTPTLTCDGSPCSVGGTPQPNKVAINVLERNSSTGANDYTYTLSGSRRACVNTVIGTPTTTAPCAGSTTNPPPPAPYGLLAFGGGTLTLQGNNATLEVRGPAIVDSTSPSAVSIGGSDGSRRMTVYSDSTRSAPGIFEIRSPGGCSGCNTTTVSPYPPKSYNDAVVDPFAGLAYPSETGLPVYGDGAYHGPGVYSTELSISADTTFAAGVYILEAGLSISNGTVDASSGVLLFNGCGLNSPRCTGGTGGALSFTGQSAVSFTPIQTGAYQQLAVWQPRQNSNGITFAGKTATNVLRGIVYAPSGNLSIGSGNGGIQIWCVAGTNITISGNGNAVIGQ